MKLEMYMTHDIVAGSYHLPHLYFHNDEEAKRGFTEMLTTPTCEFSKHKKDMELIHIGNIDIETGELTVEKYCTMKGEEV